MGDFSWREEMTLEEILQTLPQDPFFQLWCALFLLIPLWVVAWRAL
jgi:hypothetical protein